MPPLCLAVRVNRDPYSYLAQPQRCSCDQAYPNVESHTISRLGATRELLQSVNDMARAAVMAPRHAYSYMPAALLLL